MERVIEFKGKSIRTGKWIFGSLFVNKNKKCFISTDADLVLQEIEPESICQFTGLFDGNKKKIFEKDILADKNRADWGKTNFVAYEVFYHDNDCCEYNVGFQMNRFHFHGAVCGTSDFRKFKPSTVKKMEIIGSAIA